MDPREDEVIEYTSMDQLQPGCRFLPNDQEILSYFLFNKVSRQRISLNTILDYDRATFYSTHPNDLGPKLPEKATFFFIPEDEALQNQTTREVGDIGLWRITVPKTQIMAESNRRLSIGSRMGFTFYNMRGNTPKKTFWRMTEYHLPSQIYHRHNEWIVLAKISRGTDYGEN